MKLIRATSGCRTSASPAIFAATGDHVDHPRWKTGLLEELRPSQDRCAGLLCRLDDDRVAGRQRGGCLGDHERHRRVPRQHEADDPEGLATGEVEARRADVDGVAVQFVGRAGEEVQDLDAHREVPVQRLFDDPAGVGGLEISQLALVDVGDRRKRSEVCGAGPGVEPRPRREGARPRGDRCRHVIRIAVGDRGPTLTGRGVHDVEGLPRASRRRHSVDVVGELGDAHRAPSSVAVLASMTTTDRATSPAAVAAKAWSARSIRNRCDTISSRRSDPLR